MQRNAENNTHCPVDLCKRDEKATFKRSKINSTGASYIYI